MSPPASSIAAEARVEGIGEHLDRELAAIDADEASEMVDDEVVHRPALALLADDHALESTTTPGLSPSGPAR